MEVKKEFVELRSEEVQEILSKTSPWLLRYGVIIVFLVLCLLFTGTWLIHFPDLVSASFKLASVNAPKRIISRSEGKLIKLFAEEGELVKANEVLGYIESTGKHVEILQLEKLLEKAWSVTLKGNLDSLEMFSFNQYHHLGELQNKFQIFIQSYIQLKNFLKNGYYIKHKKLLEKELNDLVLMGQSLQKQKMIYKNDINLAQEDFEVQKKLAESKAISQSEFRREESKVISRKLPYQQTATALINNSLAKKEKRKEILELDKQFEEAGEIFLQSINTFKSEIESWKLKYVIVSPISGMVYYPSIIQENQYLLVNQVLFYIAPPNTQYYGELLVPQQNFGKVALGQEVIIKFESFPFEEYGLVKGKISSIANISTVENVFRATVILPKGLKTNYGKDLPYRTGMTANAEIITLDERIIEKLFYQLRKVTGGRGGD